MFLFETIKKAFIKDEEEQLVPSSQLKEEEVLFNVYNDTIGFFDNENNTTNFFALNETENIVTQQNNLINKYRDVAETGDVADAIDEFINEAIFVSSAKEDIIKIDIDLDNEKIRKAINEEFINIAKMFDFEKNIYRILRQFYIDGKLIVHLTYNNNNINDGVKAVNVLNPIDFVYDDTIGKYRYIKNDENSYNDKIRTFDEEEIVIIDSGMHTSNGLTKGWLHAALKTASQLKTLEDLLIPMRYSRSVSRRVFNVDVSDLSAAQSESFLQQVKNKFRYKKQYNTETGEISNTTKLASLVEDYWFGNRNGTKGVEVDLLDEKGSLGELEDIRYFQKRLFRNLKVPSKRILGSEDDAVFGGDSEDVDSEEMKFYLSVMRFRNIFLQVIDKCLQYNLISKKIISQDDYEEYKESINIYFCSDGHFFQKLKYIRLMNKHDLYATMKEDIGTVYSYGYIFDVIFDMNEEDVKERMEEIEKEKTSKLFKDKYNNDDY